MENINYNQENFVDNDDDDNEEFYQYTADEITEIENETSEMLNTIREANEQPNYRNSTEENRCCRLCKYSSIDDEDDEPMLLCNKTVLIYTRRIINNNYICNNFEIEEK